MTPHESQALLDTDIEVTAFPAYRQLSNVLVRYGNKVLLLHRKTEPFVGLWSIPGGGVEDGEAYMLAACRELYEETQIKADELQPLYVFIDHEHQLESHLYQYLSMDGTFMNGEHLEHDAMRWENIDVALTLNLTPGLEQLLQTLR